MKLEAMESKASNLDIEVMIIPVEYISKFLGSRQINRSHPGLPFSSPNRVVVTQEGGGVPGSPNLTYLRPKHPIFQTRFPTRPPKPKAFYRSSITAKIRTVKINPKSSLSEPRTLSALSELTTLNKNPLSCRHATRCREREPLS